MTKGNRLLGAVIVAYHPDAAALQALVLNLGRQVDHLVVVDNTPLPGGSGLAFDLPGVEVQADGVNHGIATGLNQGIRALRQRGCRFFVLSDQDSVPAPDLVAELMGGYDRLTSRGLRVGAVGAFFVDPRDGEAEPFEVVSWRGSRATRQVNEDGVVEASVLITSGCLVPLEVFDDVGLMDDSLFIDYVDFEWCFRAGAKGYGLYGIPSAAMRHTIGDDFRNVWLMGWRKKAVHSPVRVYFQNRNTLLLCRMPHIPLAWKLSRLLKRPGAIFFYLFMIDKGWQHYAAYIFRGLAHGMAGKGGPFSAS